MARQKRDTFSDINITPLTDIFLVLLIIMMVIAPLLDQQGLSLTVPENVEMTELDKDSKTFTVFVDNEDKFYIDEEEIAPSELEVIIKEKIKTLPEGLVIETSEETTHGAMVKVMDSARNVGVSNISVTENF